LAHEVKHLKNFRKTSTKLLILLNSLISVKRKMIIKYESLPGNPMKQILFKDNFKEKEKSVSHTD
jgi:hypothetical protein